MKLHLRYVLEVHRGDSEENHNDVAVEIVAPLRDPGFLVPGGSKVMS